MSNITSRPLPKVLVIGDSISIGYTPHVQSALDGQAMVEHHAGNGEHTRNGVANIDVWLGNGEWSCIHFNFGLHDLARDGNSDHCQIGAEEYQTNLQTIISRLKKTNAKLIWATTTPVPDKNGRCRRNEDVKTYNAIAARIMKENGIAIDDLYAVVAPDINQLQQPNDVHFTAAGNRIMGNAVSTAIAAALNIDGIKPLSADNTDDDRPLILCIGDSNGEGWANALKPLVKAELLVFGQAGMTVGFDNLNMPELNMLRQVETVLKEKTGGIQKPVREVIIMLGTNDCKAAFKDRQNEIIPNYKKLIERIRAFAWPANGKPEITVVTPPPIGKSGDKGADGKYKGGPKRAAALVPALQAMGDEMNVRIINVHAPLVPDIDKITLDGVHFTAHGYDVLARQIAAGLDADVRR